MSDDDFKDDSFLSVRTPWGNLVKIQGIQSNLNSIKDDISTLNQRIRDLEQNNDLSQPTTPLNEAALKTLSAKIDTIQNALDNKRINELERAKPLPSMTNSTSDDITDVLTAFETRIAQVENRMRDLDAKFEKFSTKTLQILEQLRKGSF